MGTKVRAGHSNVVRVSTENERRCGKGGTFYIYAQRKYCFFAVATRVQNEPQGVLIRAIDPTLGIETMIKNRHGKDGVLLTNGPAKMLQAFGIHDKNWNLHFLSDYPFAIALDDRHKTIPQEIIAAARVGINQSDPVWANKKLRFYVAGNPYVSDMKKRNYETNNGWA